MERFSFGLFPASVRFSCLLRLLGWLLPPISCARLLAAQNACPAESATVLAGTVRDQTLALIPNATLTLDGSFNISSEADGSFHFLCVPAGKHTLSVTAEGFAPTALAVQAPQKRPTQITLQLAGVQTNVDVDADEHTFADHGSAGISTTITGKRLQSLADDPDDLLRQLQQLGAMNGGNPANTLITVDGFQGSSKIPPKSAIAYIKVNPDLFSAEYQSPPYGGGRIEIYTKPGQNAFHGALFTTNGSSWENARDPFSPNRAAIGKQRYGAELTGPILKRGSDFSVTLEHRAIDDYAVVNAITLSNNGTAQSTASNVATPQDLWEGQARGDWQLGARNTFIATYSANVNARFNQGVGGTTLTVSGYDTYGFEHVLRFTDVTTLSTHTMHETHLSLRWDGSQNHPLSTGPQVQVAGAFTSGGALTGAQSLHEFNFEVDDGLTLTAQQHLLRVGTQLMTYSEDSQLPSGFNGSYTFGGGTAPVLDAHNQGVPGQTETINALEQYRRTLLALPGGTPTAFSNVAGTPSVRFAQVQDAVYVQDELNPGHGLHVSAGLRYFVQNNPLVLDSFNPRLGLAWAPGKKPRWSVRGHAGMFSVVFAPSDEAEVRREDGIARVTSTVYNPVYGLPFTDATPIHSVRQFSPHLSNVNVLAMDLSGSREFPHGWEVTASYGHERIWNDLRSVNINAPLNGMPTGLRALGIPNMNLLEMQNSAQDRLNQVDFGLEQQGLKWAQLFFGVTRSNIIGNADNDHFFTPQSSFSNAGEFSHISNYATWNVYADGTLTLPGKVTLSGDVNARGGQHYNITTGFDNNGDGDFNDRPRYAPAGTPGAIQTPFGSLVSIGGTSALPRNLGLLPWRYYTDMNLQRAFKLTRDPKAEHQQLLIVNLRSSNVLNHVNVTQVGGVLGSPLFGIPYGADSGRRVEAGLRYSF